MNGDARLYAPSAARNREPIFHLLQPLLPVSGLVLEVASGSGEHVAYFASRSQPDVIFQPSDPDLAARASIDAWTSELGLSNIRPAIVLNAMSPNWPIEFADAVLSINMIHIAPWDATLGLLSGAARLLPPNGMLYLYGPFRRNGQHYAQSNARFDEDLRLRNPAWGVRDLDAVIAEAERQAFASPRIEEMPANNLADIFRRN